MPDTSYHDAMNDPSQLAPLPASQALPAPVPAALPNGAHTGAQPAGPPVPPMPVPQGAVPLGEVSRRHIARLTEQTQAGLLLAIVESAGADPNRNWRLLITGAAMVPEG
jgi:hypothetical protein